MIVRPYKFMIGIVCAMLGVGLICSMVIAGGPFSLIHVAVTLAILAAGVLLSGESIRSPLDPPRPAAGRDFSEKTKREFENAIRESLSKKAQP